MLIQSQCRMRAVVFAIAAAAATSSGCVAVGIPVRPDAWPAVADGSQWEPSAEGGTSRCHVIEGTFSASGQKSGGISFFWFVPIWWSSNKDKVSRLDEDLMVYFESGARNRPTEIDGAASILFEQRDVDHLDVTVLGDDGRVVEPGNPLGIEIVGEENARFERLTFARPSPVLENRARDFWCNKIG